MFALHCIVHLLAIRDAPSLPWAWSWDSISTFTYGTNTSCCDSSSSVNLSCCSGIDSLKEIKWKLQYDIVLIDNDLSSPGCQNQNRTVNWTKCNDFKSARAADVRAVSPSKPIFVYRGGPFGCDPGVSDGAGPSSPSRKWFDYLSATPQWRTVGETWITDRFGVVVPGTCDFRKESAQNFWLTQMVFGKAEPDQAEPPQRWIKDTNISGFFSDSGLVMGWKGTGLNITVQDEREIFNATCTTMRRMAQHLNNEKKYLTFSLKDHFSSIKKTGGGSSGGILCDPNLTPTQPAPGGCWMYGEEVLFEIMADSVWIPFREYNIPSRDFGKDNTTVQPDGCAAAVADHAIESQKMPTMACNNDGAPNATLFPFNYTPSGKTSWLEQHKVSLAAHLMGMERYSYFGSGMHWDDPGWHIWWPEYNNRLGEPLTQYTRNGYAFSRSFEFLNVSLDCATLETNFTWL